MRQRLWFDEQIVKRELFGVLPFLSNDHGMKVLQTIDLPVNVEHLQLEEGDHVGGDDWSRPLGIARRHFRRNQERRVVAHSLLESEGTRLYVVELMRREVQIVNELGLHAR